MAVSEAYLARIRRAVRRSSDPEVDMEITDIIEECRADLIGLGVLKARAEDESDALILGAVRCFARWKFGLSGDNTNGNREDYMQLRDELRKRVYYTCISRNE
jgi:hypothetical protein